MDALPPLIATNLSAAEYESLRQRLLRLPPPPPRPGLRREDWLGAVGVALWVIVTTLPVSLPFLFVGHIRRAMRLSNAIAVVMLFLTGYAFGRLTQYHPRATGFAMVLLGLALVALTMALGG